MLPPTPSASQQPVIEMAGVSAASLFAPDSPAVEGVDWEVNAGDFWAIAGLQGAGKTDFLLMAGGLSAPLAGRYKLFGEPMPIFDEARLPVRLRAGLVFEGGQLFHHLTLRQNIALPIRYHRNLSEEAAAAEVQAWVDALELQHWADRMPGAAGRIWQRRAGLARALILRPELLLVDSPISGLDLRQTNWWLRLLRDLAAGHPLLDRPLTLVVTTADLRPWRGLAHRFAVIRDRKFGVLGDWEQAHSLQGEPLKEFFTQPAGAAIMN